MFNKYDYEILNFIYSKKDTNKEEILINFPDDLFGTNERLNFLLYNGFIAKIEVFYGEFSSLSITSKGIKFIKDFELNRKEKTTENIMKTINNIFLPIFLTIVTNFVLDKLNLLK